MTTASSVPKAFGTLLAVVIPTSVSQKSLFGTVETVIAWGRVGAKDGIAALESEFAKVDTEKDAFLHHCIQLFLAGYDKENLRGKLDTFINSSYQRNMVRASILNTMANVAPAFGDVRNAYRTGADAGEFGRWRQFLSWKRSIRCFVNHSLWHSVRTTDF